MTTLEAVRNVIAERYQNVREVSEGVFKGELVHEGRPYAIAFWDLSDSIVERSADLKVFQESLVGPGFFSPDGDLRWNNYLYFLAGPKSIANGDFPKAKARIEADRHFARKFVLDEKELLLRLRASDESGDAEPPPLVDAGDIWAGMLREASLGYLLQQPPRTTAAAQISDGRAFRDEVKVPAAKAGSSRDPLGHQWLRRVSIGPFRRVYTSHIFDFAGVNLIVGANGAGKTSLLEAIEGLYCGRVRRDPDTAVYGVTGYVDNGKGGLEAIRATSAIATLKARNTAWYGRSDFQASGISQGFARFNFLDTDAAFRLSASEDPSEIKDDLGKLLVGPETAKLWDYLRKLHDDLKPRLRAATERIPALKRNVDLLEQEISRLRAVPSEASTLIKAYATAIADLRTGWAAADSGELDDAEHSTLNGLRQSAAAIESLIPTTPITRQVVQNRVEILGKALAEVTERRKQHDVSLKKAGAALEVLKNSRSLAEKLKNWQRLLAGDVPKRAAALAAAETALRDSTRQLNGVGPSVIGAELAEYENLPLRDAQDLAKTRLEAALAAVKTTEADLARSVEIGQSLASLRRDLHDAALALVQKNGEWHHCPICHSPHAPLELQKTLDRLIEGDLETATAGLRRNVQVAREQAHRERRLSETVATLAKFGGGAADTPSSTCAHLQRKLKTRLEEHTRLSEQVKSLTEERDGAIQLGLDWNGWQQDFQQLQRALKGVDLMSEKVVVEELARISQTDVEQSKLIEAEGVHRNSLNTGMSDLTDLLGAAMEGLTLPQKISVLERELAGARQALQAFNWLADQLPALDQRGVEWVQTKLSACILAFERAKHSLNGDQQAQAATKSKQAELEKAKASLESARAERGHLSKACQLLKTMAEKFSLEQMTATAFSSIKGKVSAIFARIHSPSEYELGEFSDGALIVRRDGKVAHEVNQVSTGQRAALALSIFLALNETAKSAPPVILIDDPVAHVDDLNALSFLDYLREIALRGERQIFFATADVRLAALFQRKFEFLGRDHFRKIVLPQEAVVSL